MGYHKYKNGGGYYYRGRGPGGYYTRQGCYIATCVYGSYDCPEVWILRRFRDSVLARSWLGRRFISAYYAVSSTVVKLFGKKRLFQKFWKKYLDKFVEKLRDRGFRDTPYRDPKI